MRRDRGETVRLGSKSVLERLKDLPTKWLVVLGVIAIIGIAQLERFISQGTILGYKINDSAQQEDNKLTPDKDRSLKETEACKKIPQTTASTELGSDVERIGGIFEDRKEPTFISVCTYRTVQKPSRTITIVIRDAQNEDAAKQSLANIFKNGSVDKVDGLGDESVFATQSLQLTTRKGKRISTVTVSKPQDHSKTESKVIAEKLMKNLL
jgi:hypothetical protein